LEQHGLNYINFFKHQPGNICVPGARRWPVSGKSGVTPPHTAPTASCHHSWHRLADQGPE